MQDKVAFLKTGFTNLLRSANQEIPGTWGKMNLHGMIEHMSDSVRVANGKELHECHAPEEQVEKMQAFIMSDKQMRENTKNPHMSDEPAAIRAQSITHSIDELQSELNDFFRAFEKEPDRVIINPFFGPLNYEKWVNLLYKHAMHHLRQFGLAPQS